MLTINFVTDSHTLNTLLKIIYVPEKFTENDCFCRLN